MIPSQNAAILLRSIVKSYLIPESQGRNQRNSSTPNMRRPAQNGKKERFDWRAFVQNKNSNILGISGEPLSTCLQLCSPFLTNDPPSPSLRQTVDPPKFPYQAFDTLEHIVFHQMQEKHFESFKESFSYRRYFDFHVLLARTPVTEDDFTLFRVLGRGGFGVVSGCKKRQSGKLYAMKVLDRRRVKMMGSQEACLIERNILANISSPFLLSLTYAFRSPTQLYLILDLMTGGDLRYHLRRKGRFNASETIYYIARTVLGLEAIHNMAVAYRDLKPDNILLTATGASKLSDFGLAATVSRKGLKGSCGTRGYSAPEMLTRDHLGRRIPYGLSIDWFSLGCVLYEFLVGVSPFCTEVATNWGGYGRSNQDKAIDLATAEMEPFFDPDVFDPVTQDFCSKLLIKSGKDRLGANGAGEVMSHAYFDGISWEAMRHELVPPPSVPPRQANMMSQGSIGTFQNSLDLDQIQLNLCDLNYFEKWDFVRPSAFYEEAVLYLQYVEEYVSGNIVCVLLLLLLCQNIHLKNIL